MLGQVKLNGYRQPIWNFYASYGSFYFEGNASRQRCVAADQRRMLGAWTDIVLGADYSLAAKTGAFDGNFIKILVNGKDVHCSTRRPILTTEMISKSSRSDGKMHFDWGIYNSYVSRWLNRHKTKTVKVDAFVDDHKDSGLVVRSSAQRPFEVDWGVKLPTQVVYYDEMRWGPERKDVDIRLMEATDNYVPVD